MDWNERLRRNRQRIASDRESRFGSISEAFDRAPRNIRDDDDDEPGFLGAISGAGKVIYDIGKGVGDLVGGAVEDIATSANDSFTGIRDVITGSVKAGELSGQTDKLNEINRRRNQYVSQLSEADFDRPEIQKTLADLNMQAEAIQRQAQETRNSDEIKRSQAVDPVKTAASTADTFLTVASAGGAGAVKNLAATGLKQGARAIGREVVKTTGKKQAASAGTRLGRDLFEGATVGAAQGGLTPFREEGASADWQDALMSGATGAALSTALAGGQKLIFDKGVRDMAVKGVREGVEGMNNMPRAVREGGYINLGGAPEAADIDPTKPDLTFMDDLFGPAPDTPASVGRDTNVPTKINLNDLNPVRRARIQQELESGSVDLNKFRPEEKNIILSEVDNVIAEKDPALRAQLEGANDVDSLMTNRSGGDFTMPILTKQEVKQYFGSADKSAWPLKYTAKKGDRSDVAAQAAENGFDDVEEYMDRARQIMAAKSTSKETTKALTVARKNPEYLLEAIRRSVIDETPEAPMRLDTGRDVQRSLGKLEARNNPWVDYVNTTPTPPTVGAQQTNGINPRPYDGFTQDLSRPALPSGEEVNEILKNFSPAQIKRAAAKGPLPEEYTIGAKGSRSTPIELPADSTTLADTATRRTPSGKVTPIMNGPNGVRQSDYDAIKELQELNNQTGKFKTIAPTKDLNTINEDLTRDIGGIQSKPGQMIERIRQGIQTAGAESVRYNNAIREEAEEAFQRYNFTSEQWDDINHWLNQQGTSKSQLAARAAAFKEIGNKYGSDVAGRAAAMFNEWSPRMREALEAYNQTMTELGQTKRLIGDLGPNYWPRVYAQRSFKDKATDVTRGIIDLKQTGLDKTGFNPNTFSGSSTQANMTLGGESRAFSQAPIGSEMATPTAAFTGHAKSRTATAPIQAQVNPLEAAIKYLESVNTAKTNSTAVYDIRGVQKAIKAVQEETGDNAVTILHDVLNNSANALLGKTNEFDRAFSRYHVTQKALEYGGFIAKQLSRSQLLGSLKTVFAQTGQAPLIAAELGVDNAMVGIRQTFSKDMEKLFEQSDFLASNKMIGNKSPFSASQMKRMVEKTERVAGWGMDAAASASARATWAAAYAKVTKEGLSGKAAIQEADRLTGKIVGNRTAGLRPSIYESRALQPIAMYTLDINQMYQATKGYIGEKNYKALGTLVAGAFAYNLLYQQLTGDKLLADPAAATADAGNILFGNNILDENDEPIGFLERVTRAGGRLAGEAAAATPLGNVIAGSLYPERGFKIPFAGGDRVLSRADMFGDSQIGRFGGSAPITSAFENPLNLLGIPGSNQAQRSFEGLDAFYGGESATPTGRQRFTIEQDPENFIRALLYGQFQTREGREYLRERNMNLRGETDE